MPMNFLSLSRVVFYLLLHVFYVIEAPTPALTALYVVSAAFLVVTSAMVVQWIPVGPKWNGWLFLAELVWCLALNLIAGTYDPGGPMLSIYAVVFVSLFLILEPRWWRLGILVTVAVWLFSFVPEGRGSSTLDMFMAIGIYGAFNLFSGAVGALVRSLRDERNRSVELLEEVEASQAALERVHKQLQESAAQQQEMAVLQERQRLAREIHDSVAHGLTALVVQIQAARRVCERSPEQAVEGLVRCEEVARQALLETRQAVRALHPSGLGAASEIEALQRLGRDFGVATGIAVTIEADEEVRKLRPDPGRVEQLYRIFQEALTNAHRHGNARSVSGVLRMTEAGLEFVIQNDGTRPSSMEPGVGFRSMTERVRMLGGSLSLEPGEQGLTIRVTVPITREAVS